MIEVVRDLSRPDVNGTPPKMKAIGEATETALTGLFGHMVITTNDNIMSSVTIHATKEPKNNWKYGIFHNATYVVARIIPKGKRYYTEGEPVTVEVISSTFPTKFRKYTGAPEKAIAKLKDWIAQNHQP